MMEKYVSSLECRATLEYVDKARSTVERTVVLKKAVLKLMRNQFYDVSLQIEGDGDRVIRFQLEAMNIRNRFANEGKAAIVFEKERCTVLISNAPPSQLFCFLKLLIVKVFKSDDKKVSDKERLMTFKSSGKEEISPLTDLEIEKARMKAMGKEDKTPTGVTKATKRPRVDGEQAKAKKNCLRNIAEQELCGEQRRVLEAVKSGRSVFFTGSAGSGKSHLLKSIIAALPPAVTVATASTGVAACHIGGTTLHQFAGIGTGEGSVEQCVKLAMRTNSRNTWKRCKHLIIDEISMVDASFFDKMEQVARTVRNNELPFGGIKLIICGDFFQLPPVGNGAKFCFQAQSWQKCIDLSFELKTIHRQSDPVFIDMLQNIRIGRVTSEIGAKLSESREQVIEKEGILPTRLCTHTAQADEFNTKMLDALPDAKNVFVAIDTPDSMSFQIGKQCPVPKSICLKKGAQVMLMKNLNLNNGLVNGARGVVVSFEKDGMPVVKFSETTITLKMEKFTSKTATGVVLTRNQLPLTLAWSFSIHKSQGLTLDCVEMNIAKAFAPGHAYVALSRAKSLQGLRVLNFDCGTITANQDVLVFYQKFRRDMRARELFARGIVYDT